MKIGTVVMTGRAMPAADRWIRAECDVRSWDEPGPMPRQLLLEWIADADGLMSVGGQVPKIDEELVSKGRRLRVISQSSVGYDNIDVAACTARTIPVGNTPGVLTETTADLAFALLLCVARRIPQGWDLVRGGQWTQTAEIKMGTDLYEKTLGIVGMGQIGAAVARRAQACGMRVLYHNRNRRNDDNQLKAEYVPFDDLLSVSDFIVILTSLTPETKGMFGREEFAKMKRTAFLINAARGAIVDTEALCEALRENEIAGCGIDVTDPEPLPKYHPLIELPNVLITPHIGTLTTETRTRMAMLGAENLLRGLERKPLKTCVNPEVNYK